MQLLRPDIALINNTQRGRINPRFDEEFGESVLLGNIRTCRSSSEQASINCTPRFHEGVDRKLQEMRQPSFRPQKYVPAWPEERIALIVSTLGNQRQISCWLKSNHGKVSWRWITRATSHLWFVVQSESQTRTGSSLLRRDRRISRADHIVIAPLRID